MAAPLLNNGAHRPARWTRRATSSEGGLILHLNTARRSRLSLLLPLQVAAQASGTLTGTVVGEESTPLAEARIRMAGVGMVVSDKDGRFRLTGVSHGDHVLEVRRLGYREFLQPVTIRAGCATHARVVPNNTPPNNRPALIAIAVYKF